MLDNIDLATEPGIHENCVCGLNAMIKSSIARISIIDVTKSSIICR